METNGNGWVKPILIGIAVIVISAVIVGSTQNTYSNSLAIGRQEVKVEVLEVDLAEQKANIAKIPVMDERILTIQKDVAKVLRKLEKE